MLRKKNRLLFVTVFSKRHLGVRNIIYAGLFLILCAINVRYTKANIGVNTEIAPPIFTDNNGQLFMSEALKCRLEKAPLERLDCYDNAWQDKQEPRENTIIPTGDIWQRANDSEIKRKADDLTFLVSDSGVGIDRKVIITTPALGSQPPRPIFMVSCKDNITRMQIVLMKPIKGSDIKVKIIADNREHSFKWFIRENGYVIESSRGLDGIAEIQSLFGADKMQIISETNSFNPLTFLIGDLKQTIKPLREACHW